MLVYLYFLFKSFLFQKHICIDFHELLMTLVNLNVIAILNIHSVDYCCTINRITKSEAVKLLQHAR